MTNANRFNKSARCSSSCSLLENKLSDPDCEIEATLAGKKGGNMIEYYLHCKITLQSTYSHILIICMSTFLIFRMAALHWKVLQGVNKRMPLPLEVAL